VKWGWAKGSLQKKEKKNNPKTKTPNKTKKKKQKTPTQPPIGRKGGFIREAGS